jgi:hypothetical protein
VEFFICRKVKDNIEHELSSFVQLYRRDNKSSTYSIAIDISRIVNLNFGMENSQKLFNPPEFDWSIQRSLKTLKL